MKQVYPLVLAGWLVFAPTNASAQTDCQPEFLQSSQTVVVPDITVNAGSSTTQTFGVRIRNAGSGGGICPATLRVAHLSTSPSTTPINYTIQTRGQTLQILPTESSPGTSGSDLNISNLPVGPNGANFPFQLTIPSGWGLPAGTNTDDLLLLLVDGTGAVVDQMQLTISYTIAPSVELRIVGATGVNPIARVDLGILDPQAVTVSDPFGVRIWSTSPYSVSFRSQNDGNLVQQSLDSKIAYRLYMDGSQVDVRGATAAYVPHGTDALGDLHPLMIRIEPFLARAGDYSDRVEVTVTAS